MLMTIAGQMGGAVVMTIAGHMGGVIVGGKPELLEVRKAASVGGLFILDPAASAMSAFGTKRTCQPQPRMSAFGVKRTCLFALQMSANDPQRTSRGSVVAYVQSATIILNKVLAPLTPHRANAAMQSTEATIPVDHSSQ